MTVYSFFFFNIDYRTMSTSPSHLDGGTKTVVSQNEHKGNLENKTAPCVEERTEEIFSICRRIAVGGSMAVYYLLIFTRSARRAIVSRFSPFVPIRGAP